MRRVDVSKRVARSVHWMCGALHRLRNGRVQAARDTRARLVLCHRVAIRNQEAA
jgi:hypothetical protein